MWERAKFHVYRVSVCEKPIFGPLSKNNTGMAGIGCASRRPAGKNGTPWS